MEAKDKIRVLQVVRANLKISFEQDAAYGICDGLTGLKSDNMISHKEYCWISQLLRDYVITRKVFYNAMTDNKTKDSCGNYYWKAGKLKPRYNWIDREIKKLM